MLLNLKLLNINSNQKNLICFINSIYFLIIFKTFFLIVLIIIFKRLDNFSIGKSKRFIIF
jgi:hypothetical protein